MAIKLGGNKPAAPAVTQQPAATAKPAATQQTAPAQQKVAVVGGTTGAAKSFLKRGAAGQEAFAKEETKAALTKDRPFRFFMKAGGEAAITFLDGGIVDGALDVPYYYEHFVKIGGKPHQFVCTNDSEPCPLCEGGDEPAFVGALTIIDHTQFTDKNGNAHKDQKRLFVAKRGTLKMLTKLALKRDGLRGCTFDVSRTGDKDPAVGNVFDFTAKLTDQQLTAKYGDNSVALDYDVALGYLEAPELRKLGFGSIKTPVGSEPPLDESFDQQL